MNRIDRARRYVNRLPAAISGSGGHNQTLTTACRLVEFGLSDEEAWEVLLEWNMSHCRPPWDESELRHKLNDAFRRSKPRPEFVQRFATGPRTFPTVGKLHRPPPVRPSESIGSMPHGIPTLDVGTGEDCAHLARVRGISESAVALASSSGLVRFGTWRGARSWFVLDSTRKVVQGRRLDGLPFAPSVKAWTLRGSQARWPVGINESGPKGIIALVEGGPDLLAAFHFILAHRRTDVAPVAVLGAAVRIHSDALPCFAGKRVRIFAHADPAGDCAAQRWANQLATAGAEVDAFSFHGITTTDGTSVNDLNDLARLDPQAHAAFPFLQSIFP
jgi:hypothetical protein